MYIKLEKKKRDISLDIIKLISAYMVVFYHFGHIDKGEFINNQYHCTLGQYLLILCSSSIPMFFMVNGALLLNKEYSIEKIYSKAGKIALLTFVWSFIDFPSWFMKTLIVLYLFYPVLIKIYRIEFARRLLMIAVFFFPFL